MFTIVIKINTCCYICNRNNECEEFDHKILEEFFEWLGYPKADVFECDKAIELEKHIVFDGVGSFYIPDDDDRCETVKVYEWWDGSSWQSIELTDDDEESIITIDEEKRVFLDNSNDVCSVVEINGEKVKNMYLVRRQWQSDHAKGLLLDKEELEEYLKPLEK